MAHANTFLPNALNFPDLIFYIFPLFFGMNGIFAAQPVSDLISMFLAFALVAREGHRMQALSAEHISEKRSSVEGMSAKQSCADA